MSALTAGIASVGTVGRHSIVVSATEASGGTSPYQHTWELNWPRDGLGWRNATGTGVTTLDAVVKNLGPSASYEIRLIYADSAQTTVFSNTLVVATKPLPWFAELASRRPSSESIQPR